MKKIILTLTCLLPLISFSHENHFHEEEDQEEIDIFSQSDKGNYATPSYLFSSYQQFPLQKGSGSKIAGVDKRTIFLTIDDGPNPGVTNHVLDTLEDFNVPATFFVVGKLAKRRKHFLERMYREGHAIGNHTFAHELDFKNSASMTSSLLKSHNVIIPYMAPERMLLFRAPGGAWNTWRMNVANSHSTLRSYIGPIWWNVGGGVRGIRNDADWKCWNKGVSVQSCATSYLQQIRKNYRNGTASLVLMHDLKRKSASLLKVILTKLKNDPNVQWKFKLVEEIPALQKFILK